MVDDVKVVVRIPLRAFYYYPSSAWVDVFKNAKTLPSSFHMEEMLKRNFNPSVSDTDRAWERTGDSFKAPESSGGGYMTLTDEQRLEVLELLSVVGTHGDKRSEGLNFIPDRVNARVFNFPDSYSFEDVVTDVYTELEEDRFDVQIDGEEPQLVNGAKVTARMVTYERRKKLGLPFIPETAKVEVKFPLRALFLWNADVQYLFRSKAVAAGWSEPYIKRVVKALNREPLFFRGAVSGEYDTVWWAVCRIPDLSDEQRTLVFHALMHTPSRGWQGEMCLIDRGNPALGYRVDDSLTTVVTVKYREDGDYLAVVREQVGERAFWWSVISS